MRLNLLILRANASKFSLSPRFSLLVSHLSFVPVKRNANIECRSIRTVYHAGADQQLRNAVFNIELRTFEIVHSQCSAPAVVYDRFKCERCFFRAFPVSAVVRFKQRNRTSLCTREITVVVLDKCIKSSVLSPDVRIFNRPCVSRIFKQRFAELDKRSARIIGNRRTAEYLAALGHFAVL